MKLKLFKLVGIAASLFCFGAISQAQNLVAPGALANTAPLPRSAFDSGIGGSSIVPKQDMAYVESKHDKRMRALWITSIVAMTAGTAADAYSSWHKQESNSVLASSNGTFGTKGVAIKAGIAGGVLIPQIVFRKHRDWYLAFAVSNFAEAGIFAGATAHNWNVK
jgi:hypothetical protein